MEILISILIMSISYLIDKYITYYSNFSYLRRDIKRWITYKSITDLDNDRLLIKIGDIEDKLNCLNKIPYFYLFLHINDFLMLERILIKIRSELHTLRLDKDVNIYINLKKEFEKLEKLSLTKTTQILVKLY
jgi:hypothetical protein